MWQRRSEKPDERPLVIVAKVKGALRVVHTDWRARELGLSPGLTLADARARIPDLKIADEDAAADVAMLDRIADWCDRYTPLVGMDGADGLILDITGCAHLLGGEAALRTDLMERLMRLGFTAQSAVAATPDAARAMARFTGGGICPPGADYEAIKSLPVAALGVEDEIVTALARAGLKTIHDLAIRPRAPLAARFGTPLLDRLLRTLGEIDHPVSPRRPLPDLAAERRFAEPVSLADQIAAALQGLAHELTPHLEERGTGGRHFEASFFRADGAVRRISILSGHPLRNAKTLAKLFSEKLDALTDPLDPGFGFDLIRLSVTATEAFLSVQSDLGGGTDNGEEVAELIDRLGARFGTAHVQRLVIRDSHVPERAACTAPAIAPAGRTAPWRAQPGEPPIRPISLFEPPEPVETVAEVPDGPPIRFLWRRVMHDVTHAEGPERIAPEWWRCTKGLTRDYFRVEDSEGRRFWLYRGGMYGHDSEHPRWFVHGLFA